jgi:hypothetical protein
MSLFVVKNLKGHPGFLRKTSGQLPNLGVWAAEGFEGKPSKIE